MKRYDYAAFDTRTSSVDVHATITARQGILYGLVGCVWLALFSFLATSSLFGAAGMWLAVGFFSISAVAAMIVILVLRSRQDTALVEFAKKNNLKTMHGARPKDIEGMDASLFYAGRNKVFTLLFMELGELAVDIGTYQYSSLLQITPDVTHTFSVVRCKLPETTWLQIDTYIHQKKIVNRHGGNYIAEQDLLSFLPTSARDSIVFAKGQFDIEIANGWLFLYAGHTLSPADSESFEAALSAIEEVYSVLTDANLR